MMGRRSCLSSYGSCISTGLLVAAFALPTSASQDFKEIVYAIVLNGEQISEGTIVLQDDTGAVFVEESDLRQWRMRVPDTGGIKFQNRTYYPLDTVDGIRLAIDAPTQTLRIEVPAGLFITSVLREAETRGPAPTHGTGAFWNYDLSMGEGHGSKSRLDGVFEGGVFNRFGIITGSGVARDIGRHSAFLRLDTAWTIDDVERRQSFRLGDSFTRGGALGRPVRFGGLQWATNFGTDPGFVTFPMPSVSGLAERASVVDVLVNNVKVLSKETPAGPFAIYNVPVTTGKGEVSVVVQDFLGREQVVSVPYYGSSSLLKKGLSDFSYEAGFARRNHGVASGDYGGLLFSGTHRYGLTGSLTGEAHVEADKATRMASIGGVWAHPFVGTFSFGVAGSHGDRGWGQEGLLGYSYVSRRFSLGITTRISSPGFSLIDVNRRANYKYQHFGNFGMGLGTLGSVGLTVTCRRQYEGESTNIITGSYNVGLRKGLISVSGYRSSHAGVSHGLTATYTIPLGRQVTLRPYGTAATDDYSAGVELQRSVPLLQSGYGYRVRAEKTGEGGRLHGNLAVQGARGTASLDLSRLDGRSSYRGGLSGSLGILDGRLFSSRWLSQGFTIARVAEYDKVRVYSGSQEVGRTNSRGYLFIPYLLPYFSNPLRVEASDLPVDCRIESTTVTAVPYARSGVTVQFPIAPLRGATVTIVGPDGAFLPAGTVLGRSEVQDEWYVALKGRAYLTDLPAGEVTLQAQTEAGRCTFTLVVPKDLSSVPDLGTAVCRF